MPHIRPIAWTPFVLFTSCTLFSACVPILGIEPAEMAHDDDCQKFVCTNGKCNTVFSEFSTPCTNAEFTTPMCNGRGLCEQGTDGACDQNESCASNICMDGVCKLDTLGECSKDSNCASGFCYDGACRLLFGDACMAEAECVPGHCVGNFCRLPDGSACDTSDECSSGACIDTTCRTSDGGTCTTNGECASGSCDGTKCKVSPGNACSSDGECGSGVCLGKICVARSCTGGTLKCGPNAQKSCCDAPLVSGGTYNRGNDSAAPATIADFRLDRFEVTVGRFRRFVDAYPDSIPPEGAGQHPTIVGSAWLSTWESELPATRDDLLTVLNSCMTGPTPTPTPSSTWTDNAGTNENLPINCIDWYLAFAFCAWDGGRLPTEAEWNYAAAGGNDQREYPWSNPPNAMTIDATYAVYNCEGMGNSSSCIISDILPVGSRSTNGDGRWGHIDLAGSMSEWTLDYFATPYATPCIDCANLNPASFRVRRGGSWSNTSAFVTSFSRRSEDPTVENDGTGIRCARASQ